MSEVCPVCAHEVNSNDAVCPTCGFKLLGATQAFRPLDVNDTSATPAASSPQRIATLSVVRGPQIGMEYTLNNIPLTIGRNPQCDIFLNDMTVSRLHARLEPQVDAYVLRDENSFNGVWVNNKNVEAHALRPGDLIQIGTFCLQYNEQ
jgi:hypothetical protein